MAARCVNFNPLGIGQKPPTRLNVPNRSSALCQILALMPCLSPDDATVVHDAATSVKFQKERNRPTLGDYITFSDEGGEACGKVIKTSKRTVTVLLNNGRERVRVSYGQIRTITQTPPPMTS